MVRALFLLLLPALCSACPSACFCIQGEVDCSNKGLTAVPQGLPGNTKHLHLSGNRIRIVDAAPLQGLPSLRVLNLSNNPLVMIEPDAVEQLRALELLDLAGSSEKLTVGTRKRLLRFQTCDVNYS